MSPPSSAANALWYASCLRGARAFNRALADVAGTQERLLLENLRRNAGTWYGERQGFGKVRSAQGYRERVPLTRYEDYRGAVERIAAGEGNVLTREPVLLLEPTGGSSGKAKLVPYTASLKAEFGRGISPWIRDLFSRDPRLLSGPAYWSVTPALSRNTRTTGGLPVGFEDDASYLGAASRVLRSRVMAVPSEVREIQDTEAFRYATLLFLLRAPGLALASAWSPTFFTILMQRLPEWLPRLIRDLGAGTLSPPFPLPPDLAARLVARLRSERRRAAEVEAVAPSAGDPGTFHAHLWPRLRLVSCWADAHSEGLIPEISRLFPQARVQGKGLIATECFVSFPLVEAGDRSALSLRSHFFEFLPEGEEEETVLAHELEAASRYSVIVTTGGGLYRYRLGDLIEVVGRLRGGCPLLRFLGKADPVSDRYGEKLHERHVREALDVLLARRGYRAGSAFAMLAFEESQNAYTVFTDLPAPDADLLALAEELDGALRENYHYRYCRRLGQLRAPRVFRIRGDAAVTYLLACREVGQRLGDVKPVALHGASGWSRRFGGEFVSTGAIGSVSGGAGK